MPMNFTPRPRRQVEKTLSALKNFVVGSSLASGTALPDALVAPGEAGEFATAADDGGRTAPFFVTFQPGGSWMSTWPAEITFDDDGLELPPQPDTPRTST